MEPYRKVTISFELDITEKDKELSIAKALEQIQGMSKDELEVFSRASVGSVREDIEEGTEVFAKVNEEYDVWGYQKNEKCFVFKWHENDEDPVEVDLDDNRFEIDFVMGTKMCYINGGGVGGGNVEAEDLTDFELATQIYIEEQGL